MIDLYTWATPNGRKISILLEELGLAYAVHPVDIGQGAQHADAFLRISPNNKIPAIVERDTGLQLMESGAIMWYLAEKHGRFLPEDPQARARTLQWLMWQMSGLGPSAGPGPSFPAFQPGPVGLFRAAFPHRGPAPLWCPGPSAGWAGPCQRRIFDCRHGLLALGGPVRMAPDRPARLSQCPRLVSTAAGPACGSEGLSPAGHGRRNPARLRPRPRSTFDMSHPHHPRPGPGGSETIPQEASRCLSDTI